MNSLVLCMTEIQNKNTLLSISAFDLLWHFEKNLKTCLLYLCMSSDADIYDSMLFPCIQLKNEDNGFILHCKGNLLPVHLAVSFSCKSTSYQWLYFTASGSAVPLTFCPAPALVYWSDLCNASDPSPELLATPPTSCCNTPPSMNSVIKQTSSKNCF